MSTNITRKTRTHSPKQWALAAAVAAAVAATSLAASAGQGPMRADVDGSGTISEAEFLARAADRPAPAEAFAAMDRDDDGYVTRRELRSHMIERMAERRLARVDADGDGMVSEDEFIARAESAPTPQERFAKRDRNDDGVLTADEMGRRHADRSGKRRGHGERPGKRFKRVDSDGDGRWSEAEFLAHAEQRPEPAELFARLDADGDGELTRDELRRQRR